MQPTTPSHTVAIALLCCLPALAAAQTVGSVEFISGDASILGADNRTRAAARGSALVAGETVDTGRSRVHLRMVDGAYIALQPGTSLRLDDYHYRGVLDGSERGLMSLLRGGMRTITGAIGRVNRDRYRLTTSVATLGIRGTEFAVTYGNSVTVNVGGGEVAVCNSAGCLDLAAGQTGYVAGSDVRPVLTQRTVSLPAPAAHPVAPDFQKNEDRNGNGEHPTVAEHRPAPTPTPTPTPTVIPLASGSYGVSSYVARSDGMLAAGLLGGTVTFDVAGGMTDFVDCCGFSYTGGVIADFSADGVIAWGRWSGGTSTHPTVPGAIAVHHYAVGIATPAPALDILNRSYVSFGSTAPTAQLGGVVTAGAANAATGTLALNFGAGTAAYALTVPVAGFTFSLGGTATFINNSPGSGDRRFLGGGTISSTGAGCTPSCTGQIPFGPNVMGLVFGTSAERANLNYGFISPAAGQISGAVVFK